jgi:hypothetical protein
MVCPFEPLWALTRGGLDLLGEDSFHAAPRDVECLAFYRTLVSEISWQVFTQLPSAKSCTRREHRVEAKRYQSLYEWRCSEQP